MTRIVKLEGGDSRGIWAFSLAAFLTLFYFFYKLPLDPLGSLSAQWRDLSQYPFSSSLFLNTWLSHFLTLGEWFALAAIMIGTGERLLRLIRIKVEEGPLTWALRLGLGWLFWGLLALGLALSQLLYPALLMALLGFALFILGYRDRSLLLKRLWPMPPRPSFPFPWGAVGLVLLLSLANLLCPEMSWDAMTYQLLLPKFYLIHHGIYAPAGMIPAHYPALGQMLFTWGLVWGDDSVARGFSFLAHMATALALVGLGNKLENPRAGWLAAALYWFFPYLDIYSTRGYVDLITGFYATLGLGLLLPPKDGENRQPSLLPWLFLGAVWGYKYNAFTFWLGGLAMVFVSRKQKNRLREPSFWMTALLPLLFFLWPWALKSWWYTGNPVFPHLDGFFPSFGWTDFDAKASNIKFHVEGLGGLFKAPLSLWNLFFNHFSGAPNEEVNPLLLILAVFPFWRRFRSPWTRTAVFGLAVPGILWLCTSPQLRLLSPVIALACLVWGAAAGRAWTDWAGKSPLFRWGFVAVLWLNALSLFQGLFHQPDPLPCFLGLQSREQFLNQILAPRGYWEVMKTIGQKTPKDSKPLITGLQNGYYLERESCFDYGYVTPVLRDWIKTSSSPEGLFLKFKEQGITHWLINGDGSMSLAIESLEMGLNRYDLSPLELHNYEQFFLHYTTRIPLEVGGAFSLYAVAPVKGFSDFPGHLPGSEGFYAYNLIKRLGLKHAGDLFGMRLSAADYLAAYREVAQQHPELGQPSFEWAWASLAQDPQAADQAVSIGREGFQRNGDEASYLNLLGSREMIRGHDRDAAEFFLKAFNLSPTRESVARNLAYVYYHLHDLNQAARWATMASQLAPYSEDYRAIAQQFDQAARSTSAPGKP